MPSASCPSSNSRSMIASNAIAVGVCGGDGREHARCSEVLESDAPGASDVAVMLLMLDGNEELELLEMAQGGNGVVSGLWRRCG